MRAIVNLKHEPKLREAFEYTHVVDNTVLIDRRTKWRNPFKVGVDGSQEEVIARYPRGSLAPHPRGRGNAGGVGRTPRLLAGLLVRTAALSWRCAGAGSRMGVRTAGRASRCVTRVRSRARSGDRSADHAARRRRGGPCG